MYPFLRFVKTLFQSRRSPTLPLAGTHVSQHICWPWDLDPFLELNNGRTLTLYDLGRFGLGERMGLLSLLKREAWGLTIAGSSVRYRRRLRAFDRFEMRTRTVGWDDRFLYMEQAMWRRETCTSHLLVRVAITDRNGLVPMDRVAATHGIPPESPPLPAWISAWIDAEAQRPWPPMQDDDPFGIGRAA
ncbi:MAG: thioesterase family protein [Rhodobacteraceae bacterium]|nr:thioesterase family protein [Paracoccaceae bacterium]